MSHPPNPAIMWSLNSMFPKGKPVHRVRIADLGCGKLRHFRILSTIASELILVDSEDQLSRVHKDAGKERTVKGFTESISNKRKDVRVMTTAKFSSSTLALDIVFCIAVFDVVLRSVRKSLIQASERNLRKGGRFVVIAPRNDSSILCRCTSKNRYKDGHVFHHHGVTTFFTNLNSIRTIRNDCNKSGLQLDVDLSRYRQLCLIFSKSTH